MRKKARPKVDNCSKKPEHKVDYCGAQRMFERMHCLSPACDEDARPFIPDTWGDGAIIAMGDGAIIAMGDGAIIAMGDGAIWFVE